MARGGGSLISGVRRGNEKKTLAKSMKKMKKALEQQDLLLESLKQSNLLLKSLIEEERNLTMKMNSSSPSNHDSTVKMELQDQDRELTVAEDGSSELSKRDDDSDRATEERVLSEEELEKFNEMATYVVKGYNADKGRKKYKFHKILSVVSEYELSIWYYFLTFEVENLESPTAAPMRICRAEVDDYGYGEAYIESCRVTKNLSL